jgi:hypothetical protein
LTSQLDPIPSVARRLRRAKFQPHHGRHHRHSAPGFDHQSMETTELVIRNADDLVEAFRIRKAELGLSNAAVEAQLLWADGICDKYLGPSRTLHLNAVVIEDFMTLFAIEFTMRINPDLDAKRRDRLQRRDERQVRPQKKLSKELLAIARKQFFQELSACGNAARKAKVSAKARSRIARVAALSRWKHAAVKAASASEGASA